LHSGVSTHVLGGAHRTVAHGEMPPFWALQSSPVEMGTQENAHLGQGISTHFLLGPQLATAQGEGGSHF
jgi:hypothetical protein